MMKTLEENKVSVTMRRHALVTLRAALGYAVKMGLAATNAFARMLTSS